MRRSLRVLICAGPTREPIDRVRFLSNYSTGFMGRCLVTEARRRGHMVTLVSGPTTHPTLPGVRTIWTERACQMRTALQRHIPKADVLIMAAAVCDFQPVAYRHGKLPRKTRMRLALKATPDILASLPRREGQLRVGFSLEAKNGTDRAFAKLKAKRLDLIVGQTLNASAGPFGDRPVKAFLIDAYGNAKRLGRMSKRSLSCVILDEIERLWYGGKRSKGVVRQHTSTSRNRSGDVKKILHAD